MAKLTASEVEIIKQTEAKRFWSRVKVGEPGECWPTTFRAATRSGHQQIKICGLRSKPIHVQCHRMAWVLTHDVVPDGLYVLHKCGNPKCCNPAHLYLGTLQENSLDSVVHGTHSQLKLSEEDVQRIRALHNEGHSVKSITEMVDCSERHAYRIINGEARL